MNAHPTDGGFDLWMGNATGNYSETWKAHAPGSSRLQVWMKMRGCKVWTRLGLYEFGPVRNEVHNVIKRGKPYTTHIVRRASRVAS